MRIRLAQVAFGGTRSLAGDLSQGRRLVVRLQTKQPLKRNHGCCPAVVAEGEFVQIDLQMLRADGPVCASQPGLEVADSPVDPGHDRFRVSLAFGCSLGSGPVVAASFGKPRVTHPAVRVDDGARGDIRHHEGFQGLGRGVVDDLHADPAGSLAPHFNGHCHLHRGGNVASPSPSAGFAAADLALIDLDLTGQQAPFGRDHGPAQLVEHRPRGLIATQTKLALQLERGDPGGCRGHQIRGPKPLQERGMGPVQNGARRQRGLVVAGGAFPGPACCQGPRPGAMTDRADEAIWPTAGEEIVQAGVLTDKARLELQNRSREVRLSHGNRLYLS